MASSIVQLISKKFVKPYFSTAPSLRSYKLSLLDQLMTSRYIPMALFYPNQQHKRPDSTSQMSSILEESLSKTLTSYYPFAGRLTDNISVNCNDMGATFLEARIRCTMSEILREANTSAQDIVYPSGIPWSYYSHDHEPSLVVAQLSHFDCGGKALSVCMTHKVGDGNTLCNFINDWAAMARQPSEKPSPQFIGASVLPPNDDPSTEPVLDEKEWQHCVTMRYVFDPEKLSQLKAKATAEGGVHQPTRVEVVNALIYKCAMAASMANSRSFKPSVFGTLVSMRPLIGPPVTQNYVGNFISKFLVSTSDEREINFSRIVREIRRAKIQHYEKHKGIKANDLLSATLQRAEQVKVLQGRDDIDEYECSSLCRFPTYHIDFGWGRPIRVSIGANSFKNYFLLMDNQNVDGIEAFLTMEEQVMSVFQNDPELLAFASLTSSF